MKRPLSALMGLSALVLAGCSTTHPADLPEIVSFTASSATIAPGDTVTLSWQTRSASAVEIVDDTGASLDLSGEVGRGEVAVAPARTRFYVLRATGAGTRATAFVQVAVDEPLRHVFLVPVPPRIASGETAQLLWSALHNHGVRVRSDRGEAFGLKGESGSVEVSPDRTTVYALEAQQGGEAQTPLAAVAEVQVEPAIDVWTVTPRAAHIGERIILSWETRGADALLIAESNLGFVLEKTETLEVAAGSVDVLVPATLPSGVPVRDGLPLRFTLLARTAHPDVQRRRDVVAVVGSGPSVGSVTAPEVVTLGSLFSLQWTTTGAERVTVRVGGLPVFETLAREQSRVGAGSVQLPAPEVAAQYEVVATDGQGLAATAAVTVRPVPPPTIASFSLTPWVDSVGDGAVARWQTRGAARLHLRLERGPTLAILTEDRLIQAGARTLHFGSPQTLVLEAYNAAGAVVSQARRVAVGAPAAALAPSPAPPGSEVTLTWDLSAAGVTEVVGLPTAAPEVVTGSAAFVDLRASPSSRVLDITDVGDGVARFEAPEGFRFPFRARLRDEFWVSVDGLLLFSAPRVDLAATADLTAFEGDVPALVAPFWDDLLLGPSSSVRYELDSTLSNGERRLIVQWSRVQRAADAASELTFQAQLYESGQVSFVYHSLVGVGAQGEGATIGVWDAASGFSQPYARDAGAAVLSPGAELNFLSRLPAAGSLTFMADRPRWLDFVGRTSAGLVPVRLFLGAYGPGDAVLSELMPLPDPGLAATGQWVELQSALDFEADFGGLIVTSTGSTAGGITIPPSTLVPPRGYLVVGRSLDPALNGGAHVDLLASDVPLAPSDETVTLSAGSTTLDVLTYATASTNASVQPQPRVLVAPGKTFGCTRVKTFGEFASVGTPAGPNERCAPYVLERVPEAFVDLSSTGTERLGPDSADPDVGTFPLEAPFTYFGRSHSRFNLSVAGFISFGAPLEEPFDRRNDATPGAGEPNGVVAVFWDELGRSAGGRIFTKRLEDRTIVSWQNFRVFGTTTVLSFQVHLLDSQALEFHYGAMVANGSPERATGSSATAWLESLDGSLAVPVNVNTAGGLLPHSGFRLTPGP
jgi:hypothetical protein